MGPHRVGAPECRRARAHTHSETEGKKPANERGFPRVSGFQRFIYSTASLVAQTVKIPPAIRETRVQSLGREDLLEEGMASHLYSCLEKSTDRGA